MDPTTAIYFQELCKSGKLIQMSKGTFFASVTSRDNGIYCLEQGLCALIKYTSNGEEIIYHYFKPGDIIGGVPFHRNTQYSYGSTPSQIFEICAKTPCRVYKINFKQLHEITSNDPHIAALISESVADHFLCVLNHFHSAKEDYTSVRLCKILLDLAQYKDDEYILDKHFTYVELAKYLGVHCVTVSRVIRKLKDLGIVAKKGHCIVIKDMDGLNALIHSPELLSTT